MIKYSSHADTAHTQAQLTASPHLEKFVFEFCQAFPNVRVRSVVNNRVILCDESGIDLGDLFVEPRGATDKTGALVPRYEFQSILVKKQRHTNTNRNTRDSLHIKSLIKTLKTNNEVPTTENMVSSYKGGIDYAFNSTRNGTSRIAFGLGSEEQLALVKSFLQLDTLPVQRYAASIRESYDNHMKKLEQATHKEKTYERFCAGSYFIGILTEGGYIVGEASKDGNDKVIVHEGVKRYATLKDHPQLAGIVAMIHAWASGQPFFDKDNELGLPVADKHYPDIDVASGYKLRDKVWVLIPKTPE